MSNAEHARAEELHRLAEASTGFLSAGEGRVLREAATRAASSGLGPLLEIGSYLGRSTLFLAAGIVEAGASTVLYSLDHHHGSEEMQAGWPDHDPSLVDETSGKMDSLMRWRRRIEDCGADDVVIGVVGRSEIVASNWTTPLSFVFIDGGHGVDVEWADYRGWSAKIAPGGLLAIHDVFPDPADGGRPPYECYLDALDSGRFVEAAGYAADSLRVLIATGAGASKTGAESPKSTLATPPATTSAAISTAASE
jgi:predicted O-methyltransferase YrrM